MNEIENENGTSKGGLSFIKIIIKTTLTLPEKPLIIKVYYSLKADFYETNLLARRKLICLKICLAKKYIDIIPSQSELNFDEN